MDEYTIKFDRHILRQLGSQLYGDPPSVIAELVANSHGITPSMSAIGCPYDNACAESLFSLLKNECIYRERPKTFQTAAQLVDEYIHFYNFERIQLKTKKTPMEMRLDLAAKIVS